MVELLLFDQAGDESPALVQPLFPPTHRTYHYWHAFVPGVRPGQAYAFRAHGPHEPEKGRRFDASKVLIDPYSRAVAVPKAYDRALIATPGGHVSAAMKSLVVDPTGYDWEGDAPPRRSWAQTIIYEMHVRGFTAHPSSGVTPSKRGTYAGLIEKIPYLLDLGVTAVELLPVMQFDTRQGPGGLPNYWGYSPVSYFAPHAAYAAGGDPLTAIDEFRDMVKALHRAGIEVILDVVYNHTAEAGPDGPTFCWRGLDNDEYYLLETKDKSKYADYTGCGNTLDTNHSVVRRMIVDSLCHWVEHFHVDGFRFDLASVFCRDSRGRVLKDAPIVWDIETCPQLAGVKLIAEPWDAAGLNQVGHFPGDAWHEWNDRFRDDVRRFVRGDGGAIRALAGRLLGSPDLYEQRQREADQSINFITAHDGFTLHDLFAYDQKHNEANREDGKDGSDNNLSWNCGHEGPTDDPQILALRRRLARNAMAILMLAQGVPMFVMGDEVLRTQRGNNNAYCQDNELSWLDWRLVEQNREFFDFVRGLIHLRQHGEISRPATESLTLAERLRRAKIKWHSTKLRHPDWSDHSRCLSVTMTSGDRAMAFHAIFNGSEYDLPFELPRPPRGQGAWRRMLDTSLPAEQAVRLGDQAPEVRGHEYAAPARSVIVLVARAPDAAAAVAAVEELTAATPLEPAPASEEPVSAPA